MSGAVAPDTLTMIDVFVTFSDVCSHPFSGFLWSICGPFSISPISRSHRQFDLCGRHATQEPSNAMCSHTESSERPTSASCALRRGDEMGHLRDAFDMKAPHPLLEFAVRVTDTCVLTHVLDP
jgi:hypothetical protein